MLKNDPPPGTPVRFVRQVQKAKQNETATILKPLRKYLIESRDDAFQVMYKGEQLTVQRQDIELLEE